MNYATSYLPEMQGMTEMQQAEFQNRMNSQIGNMQRTAMRQPMQSTGAFLGQKAKMGRQTAQGMTDIAAQNQYKNALFALEDRRKREAMDFQRKMAQEQFQRQLQMYKQQQADQQANALMGGIGSVAGMFLNPLAGKAAQGLGDMVFGKDNTMEQLYRQFFMPKEYGVNGYYGKYNLSNREE